MGVDADGHQLMGLLKRKLRTTRRVLDTDGARGVLAVAKRKLSSSIKCFESRRWKHRFDVWCQTEHPWLGRIVEWRGNKVSLDSCVFSVSSPIISTATKSLFLQDGYERCERDILKLYLNRSRAVVELGGAVGVVACVTNKMLDLPGRHFHVEHRWRGERHLDAEISAVVSFAQDDAIYAAG